MNLERMRKTVGGVAQTSRQVRKENGAQAKTTRQDSQDRFSIRMFITPSTPRNLTRNDTKLVPGQFVMFNSPDQDWDPSYLMSVISLSMTCEVGSSSPTPTPTMTRPTSSIGRPSVAPMASQPVVMAAEASVRVCLRPCRSDRGQLSRLPTIMDAERMLTAKTQV